MRGIVDGLDTQCAQCGARLLLGQLQAHWATDCLQACPYAAQGCAAQLAGPQGLSAHRQQCAYDPVAQQRRLNTVDAVVNRYKTALEDNMRHAWVADVRKASKRCANACTRAITMTTELDAVPMAPNGFEDEARRKKVHLLHNLELLETVMTEASKRLTQAEQLMAAVAEHGLAGDWDFPKGTV